MNYLLYNPLAKAGTGEAIKEEALLKLKDKFPNLTCFDVTKADLETLFTRLTKDDNVIICGGDGTLNNTANFLNGRFYDVPLYLYKAGTGNDFLHDVAPELKDDVLLLNPYLAKLPTVTVKGKQYKFVNGIGFGVDGEACRVADDMKAKGKKKINYTSISIKLVLFKFKCPTATVKVDDKEFIFKRVYIASAMNGKYYGGGMRVAPDQDRLGGKLTFVTMYGKNRIKTLMVFPKIFTGEHVKHQEMVSIVEGKRIEVTFSHPCALQIDGETVRDVTSFVAEI